MNPSRPVAMSPSSTLYNATTLEPRTSKHLVFPRKSAHFGCHDNRSHGNNNFCPEVAPWNLLSPLATKKLRSGLAFPHAPWAL